MLKVLSTGFSIKQTPSFEESAKDSRTIVVTKQLSGRRRLWEQHYWRTSLVL